ncbi:unnamed protein product [Arctogadus glacialis]
MATQTKKSFPTEQLVVLVSEHVELYDMTNKLYHNIYHKESIWRTIVGFWDISGRIAVTNGNTLEANVILPGNSSSFRHEVLGKLLPHCHNISASIVGAKARCVLETL